MLTWYRSAMLLHLRPRAFSPLLDNVNLIDLRIDALGLHLRGGVDLAARRPYPNKNLLVGCRREGRKAIDGLLIETPEHLSEFQCVMRWGIEGERVAVHTVNFRVLDRDHDAASDDHALWAGTLGPDLKERWADRIPKVPKSEIRLAPLEIIPQAGEVRRTERTDNFDMPTIERARILSGDPDKRRPAYESAFHVAARPAGRALPPGQGFGL
jgi:hypothetical protein